MGIYHTNPPTALGAHEATHVDAGSDEIDSSLDSRAIALTTQGDAPYRDATGLARLAAGVSGQALLTGGPAANPSWGAPTPAAHASTHTLGGSDEASISLIQLLLRTEQYSLVSVNPLTSATSVDIVQEGSGSTVYSEYYRQLQASVTSNKRENRLMIGCKGDGSTRFLVKIAVREFVGVTQSRFYVGVISAGQTMITEAEPPVEANTFAVLRAVNAGAAANWYAVSSTGGAQTAVDTGVLFSVVAQRIVIERTLTPSIRFYRNETLLATIATNVYDGSITNGVVAVQTRENVAKSIYYRAATAWGDLAY